MTNTNRTPIHGFAASIPVGKTFDWSGPRRSWSDLLRWANGRNFLVWPLCAMPQNQKEAARRLGVSDRHPWESWPVVASTKRTT